MIMPVIMPVMMSVLMPVLMPVMVSMKMQEIIAMIMKDLHLYFYCNGLGRLPKTGNHRGPGYMPAASPGARRWEPTFSEGNTTFVFSDPRQTSVVR